MSIHNNPVVIEGLDLFDIVDRVDKKKSKFVALTLTEIEGLNLDITVEEYKLIRKFVLDGFGDFTRSTMRLLFGDVELAPYKGYDK